MTTETSGVVERIVAGSVRDSLSTVSLLLFMALVLMLAFHRVISADLWLHLTAGRWILENGRVPREEIFSFTALGHEWIDLHWGYQLLVTAAHRFGGAIGIQILHAAVLSATAWLALRLGRFQGVTGGLALLFGALVLLAAQERILCRPELFTAFFLVVAWWASERLMTGRLPWWVLLVQVAWANMQGLFILGPAFMGMRAAGLWLDGFRRKGDATPGAFRRHVAAAAAMVAVSVVNPYALDGLLLPFRLLLQVSGESVYAPILAELRSPWMGRGTPLLVAASMAVAALSWAFHSERRFRDLIPMLAFALLAVSARRNLLLFGWMAMIPTMRALSTFELRFPTRVRGAIGVGVLALLLVVTASVAGGRFYHEVRSTKRTGLGLSAHDYPTGVVEYLSERPAGGRLYNMLGDGDYLMWHLMPEWRVMFDGRAEVYGEELGRTLLSSVLSEPVFRRLHARYRFDAVTMDPTSSVGRGFIRARHADPEWALVFYDHRGALFLPAGDVDSMEVVRDRAPAFDPVPEGRVLSPIAVSVDFPFEAARAGQLSAALGYYGRAVEAYGRALRRFPHSADLFADYGAALLRSGAPGRAREAFRTARRLDADHDGAIAGEARVMEAEGNLAGGIDLLRRWSQDHPEASRAWLTLASMELRAGDRAAARRTLEAASRRIPAASVPYARLLIATGERAAARDILEAHVAKHAGDVEARALLDRLKGQGNPLEPTEKVDVDGR